MKKSVFIAMSALLVGGLSGCVKEITPDRFMTFDAVDYVKEFPYVAELTESEVPDIDIIGINNFCIVDSMMFFSQRGSDSLWSVYSLPDYRLLGKCFSQGNGPGEFAGAPNVSYNTDFFYKDGRLFADIYEYQTGKAVRSDITAALERHETVMTLLCDSLPNLFNFIPVTDSTFYCKGFSPDFTQQLRYMAGKSAGTLPPAVQRLNEARVEDDDINIISTIAKMNRANGRIVDMPIGLNYINMYSLDGDFAKTICIGDELDDIRGIKAQIRWFRLYTFADVRVFKDFWGVVSIMEDEKTFQTERKKYPSILLFDWEGRPLAKLKLNQFISSFDIDPMNKTLYVFDVHSDEMFMYDIAEVLEKIV